jgi:hypothetical protein
LKTADLWFKYCILVPIVLSAIVHLWNPSGFPALHPDESDYIRKAMHVVAGLGPQEGTGDPIAINNQPYTHPHFGQLFLAAVLGVGFSSTNLLATSNLAHTVEFLYTLPRVVMGLLAVLDTFLIFKIADRRYDRSVALVASSLFAVMPMTWILREVYLDNILMPFLLSSILFALYIKPRQEKIYSTKLSQTNVGSPSGTNNNINNINKNPDRNELLLVIASGILLGISIYTKIPAFTMIPLVGYLIFTNSPAVGRVRIKNLAIWFIPVILIPCLWPAYALIVGEFDLWVGGVTGQMSRIESQASNKLFTAFSNLFKIDPVTLVIGFAGISYTAIRRDFWLLIWVVPLITFSYFIEWVIYFHLIPLFPAFCIAAAVLIVRIFKFSLWRKLISPVLVSAIVCFGLVSSMLLVSLNMNSYQFEAYGAVIKELINNSNNNNATNGNDSGNATVTLSNGSKSILMGHRMYYWIPKYIFKVPFGIFPRDALPAGWNSSYMIVQVVTSKACCCQCPYFADVYKATKEHYSFNRDVDIPKSYPYTGIRSIPALGKEVSIREYSPHLKQ